MTKLKDYIAVAKYGNMWGLFIIEFLLLVMTAILSNLHSLIHIVAGFSAVFFVLIVLTVKDCCGFYFSLKQKGTIDLTKISQDIVAAYRIDQKHFEIAMFFMVTYIYGWPALICGLIGYFTGFCDKEFYWGLDVDLPKRWEWLNWTIFGWFAPKDEKGVKGLSNSSVEFQYVAGVSAMIVIYLFSALWGLVR
jgi:hypothetical protein